MSETTRTEPMRGQGSVTGVPHLPAGFDETFTSWSVVVSGVRLHAVVGGSGPSLLLIGGWPQTWYAWRLVMPELARHFSVVVMEPRGSGRSEKPESGYDTATLASDATGLMDALGHETFSVVGHDIGMWIAYAIASEHPDRVERLVVAEATIPGLTASPPLLGPKGLNDTLWHFAFNRLDAVNEALVRGREDIFFGYQLRSKSAAPGSLADHAVEEYVGSLRRDPKALRASFEYYRALDETIAQNVRRGESPLAMPVLTVAGAECSGDRVEATMRGAALDLTSVVIPACGHFPAEEAPEVVLTALGAFLGFAGPGATERVASGR